MPQSNQEQTIDLSQDQFDSLMNDFADLGNIHSSSHNFPSSQVSLSDVSNLDIQLLIGKVLFNVPNVRLQTIFLVMDCLIVIKLSYPK